MIVAERTRRILEIDAVLGLVAHFCRTPLGVRHFDVLKPAGTLEQLYQRQELLRTYGLCRDVHGELPWDGRLQPVSPLLEEARETALLTGEELLRFRVLFLVAMQLRAAVAEYRATYPALGMLTQGVRDFADELALLECLSDDGRLYDSASPDLAEVRRKLEGVRRDLRQRGGRLLNDPGTVAKLQERVLSLRDGRFVVLVRQEHVNSFPGIALDRSGSGNSVYMEPNALVPHNNKLSLLSRDEERIERKIYRRLTEALLSRSGAIVAAEESLGLLDALYGTAEFARSHRWHLPDLAPKPQFRLNRAVHPLLGPKAVPISLSCGERFSQLVVTGPNTGGKTVALKTAGVALVLAWMGLPIPASEGSVVGDLDQVAADVGDEQSIAQNLSTFSAHLANIVEMLASATPRSLLLLDELGAGTDPQEGAALGIALLQTLLARRTLVLATTHHNPIKRFALTTAGVETASVEFDPATLSPTYRLLMGVPGRSNALLIAQRLGMPPEILTLAREALAGEDAALEDLIGELQEKQGTLERAFEELAREKTAVAELRERFERKDAELDAQKETILERADRSAAKVLSEAQEEARELLKGLDPELLAAAQKALTERQEAVRRSKEAIAVRAERRTERHSAPARGETVQVGSVVRLLESKVRGTVESLEGGKALVVAGGMRLEVPLKRLQLATEAPEEKNVFEDRSPGRRKTDPVQSPLSRGGISVSAASAAVPSSIMVRGMTVDEALPVVERYLDQAFRHGYPSVVVIHGHGEGILRREVQALCKRLPYVLEFRLGGPGEGSIGVTVVTFRK